MGKKLTTGILIIATAEEAPNVRYACGFLAPDPVVFLKVRRTCHLVVPPLEIGRARRLQTHTKAWTPDDLELTPDERRSMAGWVLGLLRKLDLRNVRVSPWFPLRIARQLEANGIQVDIAEGPLFPGRAVKTDDEIRKLRQAQRASVAAMRAAQTCIANAPPDRSGRLIWNKKPLTSERVREQIDQVLFQHACFGADTIVAGGHQGADPHERGHGVLRARQPIVLDIFPQHRSHGYWGDITRTVIHGDPPPEVQRMFTAVKRAQRMALQLIKPGMRADIIHSKVAQSFVDAGFETTSRDGCPVGFFHSTGHGVGLEIHEAPRVGGNKLKLKAGHVITIEPGLYYPDLGGIRIEDTVVVTQTGFRMLATMHKRFQIA